MTIMKVFGFRMRDAALYNLEDQAEHFYFFVTKMEQVPTE